VNFIKKRREDFIIVDNNIDNAYIYIYDFFYRYSELHMKIIFHEKFYESDYADNSASVPGRMEAIMDAIGNDSTLEIVRPGQAEYEDLLLAHTSVYVDSVKSNKKLYNIALLSAGAAITAADIGITGEPAFACLRPPGHHASRNSAWGYCAFCNMGIALLRLKQQRRIESAFILDFDAHTGDGTKDVLTDWKECQILNPYSSSSGEYIKEIEAFVKEIPSVDIVCVCAGFDSYQKDAGAKLSTFDFYNIGFIMKNFAKRAAGNRRFAILEGGYYLPDLGKNVLSFCQGFA
jgi:acetoin utilization deacetylase AcuC-like enzyme